MVDAHYYNVCFFCLGLIACAFLGVHGGQVTKQGLTITTSERHIGTVKHDGTCMTITCAFGPTIGSFGSPKVTELSLRKFNSANNSFNIEIEKINWIDPTPKNRYSAYKVVGNITQFQANMTVDVRDIYACHFGQYQCLLQFDIIEAVFVESDDKLAFEVNHTKEEWLIIVNSYVRENIASLSKDMSRRLYDLEVTMKGDKQEMRNLMTSSTEQLQTNKQSIEQALNESAQLVQNRIEILEASTIERLEELDTSRDKAVSNLRSKVKEKIYTTENNINQRINTINDNVAKNISDLAEKTSEKISKMESKTKDAVNGITDLVKTVSIQLETRLATMRDDIVFSILSLQENIGKATETILDTHSDETTNLTNVFTQTLSSARQSLSFLIDVLNAQIESTSTMVQSKITILEERSENVITDFKKDSSDTMLALNNTLTKELDSVGKSLTTEIDSVGNVVTDVSLGLSMQLVDLQDMTLNNVDELSQSVVTGTKKLQTTVSSGVDSMTSATTEKVQNLGSNVTNVMEDAQEALRDVRKISTERLGVFRDDTLQRVENLKNNVDNTLNVTGNNIIQNLEQLSFTLTQRAETSGSGLGNTIAALQNSTKDTIDSLTDVLQNHLTNISNNTNEVMQELTNKLIFAIAGLGDQLESYLNSTVLSINSSAENVFEDIRDLATGINAKALLAQENLTNAIGNANNITIDYINILKRNASEYVDQVVEDTSGRLLEFQNNVYNTCDAISNTNNRAESQLTKLIETDIMEIQNDTSSLQDMLNVREETFKGVESKIGTVDATFTKFKDASARLMRRLRSNMDDNDEENSKKIEGIDRRLAALEAKRINGQNEFDKKLEEVHTKLDSTEGAILGEMTSSLTVVRDTIGLWKENITRHLKPEVCVKGMPFVSLRGEHHVIISKSPDRDFDILCDAHLDRGGWIVIQRRIHGDTDFYQNWETYKNGFGNLDGDFWLGLEKIHTLTQQGTYEMYIDLEFQNRHAFARYQSFSIGNEKNDYKLTLGEYSGTAGNSLTDAQGRGFSTYDKDNDKSSKNTCAITSVGGWWYNNCHYANLNGLWSGRGQSAARWNSFSGTSSVVMSEMKIRLKQ